MNTGKKEFNYNLYKKVTNLQRDHVFLLCNKLTQKELRVIETSVFNAYELNSQEMNLINKTINAIIHFNQTKMWRELSIMQVNVFNKCISKYL